MKKILVLIIFISQLNAGADTAILIQNLQTAYQQLAQLNQAVKTAMENLDQLKAVNKTLDSVDNALDNMKLSVYDPVKGIERIKRNAENLSRRMQSLGERIANLKPEDFFRDDTDFQECLTTIRDKKGNQHDTVNAKINPFYEDLKKDLKKQDEQNKKISELTGIDMPTLEIKTCIDNKLAGKNAKLLEDIQKAREALKYNDQEAYREALNDIDFDFKNIKYEQNKILQHSIQEITLNRTDLDEQNKRWEKSLGELLNHLKESQASKNGATTNDLLIDIANILHQIATIQIQQYNLSVKAQNLVAQKYYLETSERINADMMDMLDKKDNKKMKAKYIDDYEQNLKQVDMAYDVLGVPIFN